MLKHLIILSCLRETAIFISMDIFKAPCILSNSSVRPIPRHYDLPVSSAAPVICHWVVNNNHSISMLIILHWLLYVSIITHWTAAAAAWPNERIITANDLDHTILYQSWNSLIIRQVMLQCTHYCDCVGTTILNFTFSLTVYCQWIDRVKLRHPYITA